MDIETPQLVNHLKVLGQQYIHDENSINEAREYIESLSNQNTAMLTKKLLNLIHDNQKNQQDKQDYNKQLVVKEAFRTLYDILIDSPKDKFQQILKFNSLISLNIIIDYIREQEVSVQSEILQRQNQKFSSIIIEYKKEFEDRLVKIFDESLEENERIAYINEIIDLIKMHNEFITQDLDYFDDAEDDKTKNKTPLKEIIIKKTHLFVDNSENIQVIANKYLNNPKTSEQMTFEIFRLLMAWAAHVQEARKLFTKLVLQFVQEHIYRFKDIDLQIKSLKEIEKAVKQVNIFFGPELAEYTKSILKLIHQTSSIEVKDAGLSLVMQFYQKFYKFYHLNTNFAKQTYQAVITLLKSTLQEPDDSWKYKLVRESSNHIDGATFYCLTIARVQDTMIDDQIEQFFINPVLEDFENEKDWKMRYIMLISLTPIVRHAVFQKQLGTMLNFLNGAVRDNHLKVRHLAYDILCGIQLACSFELTSHQGIQEQLYYTLIRAVETEKIPRTLAFAFQNLNSIFKNSSSQFRSQQGQRCLTLAERMLEYPNSIVVEQAMTMIILSAGIIKDQIDDKEMSQILDNVYQAYMVSILNHDYTLQASSFDCLIGLLQINGTQELFASTYEVWIDELISLMNNFDLVNKGSATFLIMGFDTLCSRIRNQFNENFQKFFVGQMLEPFLAFQSRYFKRFVISQYNEEGEQIKLVEMEGREIEKVLNIIILGFDHFEEYFTKNQDKKSLQHSIYEKISDILVYISEVIAQTNLIHLFYRAVSFNTSLVSDSDMPNKEKINSKQAGIMLKDLCERLENNSYPISSVEHMLRTIYKTIDGSANDSIDKTLIDRYLILTRELIKNSPKRLEKILIQKCSLRTSNHNFQFILQIAHIEDQFEVEVDYLNVTFDTLLAIGKKHNSKLKAILALIEDVYFDQIGRLRDSFEDIEVQLIQWEVNLLVAMKPSNYQDWQKLIQRFISKIQSPFFAVYCIEIPQFKKEDFKPYAEEIFCKASEYLAIILEQGHQQLKFTQENEISEFEPTKYMESGICALMGLIKNFSDSIKNPYDRLLRIWMLYLGSIYTLEVGRDLVSVIDELNQIFKDNIKHILGYQDNDCNQPNEPLSALNLKEYIDKILSLGERWLLAMKMIEEKEEDSEQKQKDNQEITNLKYSISLLKMTTEILNQTYYFDEVYKVNETYWKDSLTELAQYQYIAPPDKEKSESKENDDDDDEEEEGNGETNGKQGVDGIIEENKNDNSSSNSENDDISDTNKINIVEDKGLYNYFASVMSSQQQNSNIQDEGEEAEGQQQNNKIRDESQE